MEKSFWLVVASHWGLSTRSSMPSTRAPTARTSTQMSGPRSIWRPSPSWSKAMVSRGMSRASAHSA